MRSRRRAPSLKLGLPLLVIGIVMFRVGGDFVGSMTMNGQLPPCFPQSCPDLGIYAILTLAGFVLAFWGGLETFLGFLVRYQLIQPRLTPVPRPEIGTGPEDQTILSMAREFHSKARFPRRRPLDSVAWSEIQPWYSVGFKWRGIRKPSMLVLYAGLRGRLEVQDWKNLLQYYFLAMKPQTRPLFQFMGYFVVPFMLVLFAGAGISYEYGRQVSILYAQLVATPIVGVLLLLLFRGIGKQVLKQDRLIARSMGREVLQSLFEKIDGLQLPEIEFTKKRRGLALSLWPAPNITQRIENLSQTEAS